MGNTCTTTTSTHAAHVQSIRQLGSADELTFTDIDHAWKIVRQYIAKAKANGKATVVQRTGWKTIRIFVSSTFRDFDAEREMLVKRVFPDLRDWCQGRRLHLVECDLRWGVPKDSNTETTLRTCLGEIDRCYSENVMPFFVNMTSERIGWIPLGSQIPEALKQEYRWVEGMSVTEMEIMHGAFRVDNPNALFMIRDPSYLDTVPDDLQHHFIDECSIASYKLKSLKSNIAEKFKRNSRVAYYTCRYSHVDSDTKMPRFKGLEENFAPVVLQFFKERIASQYPLIDFKKQDPVEEAKIQHDSFMKMASERVVGREALIEEFVESYVNKEIDLSPVVIYGGPGLGKTSIMAALADRCCSLALTRKLPVPTRATRWRVFYHFVGAVAGSTDQLMMLYRLLLEIKTLHKTDKRPTSLDEAMGLVRGALSNPRTKNCIIIIDAINQFDDHRGMPAPISWLPSKMSPSIRLFFSLTPESIQFKSVREAGEGWTFLQLQPLDRETKEKMVTSNLAQYNKRLDRAQMELLLNKKSSDNPMWLSLATEELRIFGRFRELTNKIGALPDGLADLEADILGRFEREGDGLRLIATLCMLESSVHGLLESELLELLAYPDVLPPALMEKISVSRVYALDGEEHDEHMMVTSTTVKQDRLTARQWSDIYRVLRPFMRPFGASGEGRLDFYHRSLSKAVRNRYYFKTVKADDGTVKQTGKQEEIVKWFHQRLADYFSGRCKNLERQVEEYPFHAWKCGDDVGLKRFLCQWQIFDLMYDEEFSRHLSHSWEHVYFMTHKTEKSEEKPAGSVFEVMEKSYIDMINEDANDFAVLEEGKRKALFHHMDCLARVLSQHGRFEGAHTIAHQLIIFVFPQVDTCDNDDGQMPMLKRDFTVVGKNLSREDRLQYARYVHLKASIIDEEMRQVDYMYASQIPKILDIIESLEIVIAIFRELAPKDLLLGRSLNRVSFYYSGLAARGGHHILRTSDCRPMAVKRIDEAIEFYLSLDNQEINLADCYVTRGVVEISATPEQLEYYTKGLNLILENAGQFHPLLDRTYLNTAIYHEEAGDRMTAYTYFRKWYELLVDMYGRNHPRSHRAVRTLNESAYVWVAKKLGHAVPQIGAVEENEAEDDDGDGVPDASQNKIASNNPSEDEESDEEA